MLKRILQQYLAKYVDDIKKIWKLLFSTVEVVYIKYFNEDQKQNFSAI